MGVIVSGKRPDPGSGAGEGEAWAGVGVRPTEPD